MLVDWLFLVPLAIGHLALFVLCLNILHSTGMPEKLLDWISLGLLQATMIVLPAMLTQGSWTTWPWPAKGYALTCLGLAIVILPVVTLIRLFRKTPTGISEPFEEIDLATEPGLDRVVGDGRFRWLLRLPGNQSLKVRKVDCEVELPGLPMALDGFTLVQVSDTHFSRCYRREFFEIAVEEAARWDADLVAFTGDLLDDESTIEWVEPVMDRLRGRLGQFAILGNHDHRLYPIRAMRALKNAGFIDLEGQWTRLELDGASLALGGTSEPWGPKLDYQVMPEADFRILLSHSPDQFPKARSKGVDLVLAGHNHGGQIRLPGFGPILMPSRYSRHFDRGFFRSGPSTMYVSQGLGGKHPIRYGCHPEITRFTLRAASTDDRVLERASAELGMAREV